MKRILVTGSNKGIGLAIVESLLGLGDVQAILCSRDSFRGEEARRHLLSKNAEWEPRLQVITLDVNDEKSVTDAAVTVSATGQPLYGIVNNAGILNAGPDELMNTNVWGQRRVTEKFLNFLVPGGRIVNISSGAAPSFVEKCSAERRLMLTDPSVTVQSIEKIAEEFLKAIKEGGIEACTAIGFGVGDAGFHAYGFSKACLNAYTICLAREHPEFIVNSCSPGMIKTDLFLPMAAAAGKSLDELMESYGALPVEQSVTAPLHLLLSSDVGTGHYYGSDAKRSPMTKYRKPGSPEYDGSDGI